MLKNSDKGKETDLEGEVGHPKLPRPGQASPIQGKCQGSSPLPGPVPFHHPHPSVMAEKGRGLWVPWQRNLGPALETSTSSSCLPQELTFHLPLCRRLLLKSIQKCAFGFPSPHFLQHFNGVSKTEQDIRGSYSSPVRWGVSTYFHALRGRLTSGNLPVCHRFTINTDVSSLQSLWHVMCSASVGFLSLLSFLHVHPNTIPPPQGESLLGMKKGVLLGLLGSHSPHKCYNSYPYKHDGFGPDLHRILSLKPILFSLLCFFSLLLTSLLDFFFLLPWVLCEEW